MAFELMIAFRKCSRLFRLVLKGTACPITNGSLFSGLHSSAPRPLSWEVGSSMESSGLCLQYFIGMGNFPRNCQWMKLEIGNFEKIEFVNRFISLASYGKSKMFVDGHLEHKYSFPIYNISLDPEFFDFFNFVNFRHINDISETFHMAGTKLGIFSFNLRY
jgi:hypothetical protein